MQQSHNNPFFTFQVVHPEEKIDVEEGRRERRANPIDFALIKPDVDVRMHQSFINRDSFFWIDDQHLLQEITRHVCLQPTVLCAISWKEDIRKELLKLVTGISWTIFHIVPYGWLQAFHEVLQWCTQLLDDFVPLINVLALVKEIETVDKHLKSLTLY